MSATESGGPLAGVRVLELGMNLAGPYAGRLLAEFGAEVIKVEAPGKGDPIREWGQAKHRGRALWWLVQSRNKKLVTLDLHKEAGRRLAARLAARCDVLVENFRPGTLERWGLGPAQLWDQNPGLIVARVSGYGQTGPYASRAGFAAASEAMGGLRFINGHPGEAPPRMGISLGDSLAGLFCVQGILMALYDRDARGGKGQVVDTSITESCFALLESAVPEYDLTGHVRQPAGTGLTNVAPSNVYRTRDGKWMIIAANADNLWQRLARAIGREDLLSDERFKDHWGRGANSAELDRVIGGWVAERDAAEVDRVINQAGVVCGPVYSIADIFQDPQYRAREMLVPMEDPELGEVTVPGLVPKLSATPGELRWTGGWELGAHNREVYEGLLGLKDSELRELTREGVI